MQNKLFSWTPVFVHMQNKFEKMQYLGLKDIFFLWKEHLTQKFKQFKQIAKMHKSSSCQLSFTEMKQKLNFNRN